MNGQVFVDETKHRAYLMVAAVLLRLMLLTCGGAVQGAAPGSGRCIGAIASVRFVTGVELV